MTFEEARAAFPVLERTAYLNAGSMGPLSRASAAAQYAQERDDLENGRGGHAYIERMLALREAVRSRAAALLGVDAVQIALTTSTTDSCSIVLSGLGLDRDDEVVTTDSEHPGLLGPLHASGARVRVAPVSRHAPEDALDVIAALVTPRTRLLALSHVTWTMGSVLPVQELRARTGVPVLVDGAQSAGAIPVDVGPAEYYTVSCQKWLCGPDSLGALYVADAEGLRIARPTYFSQLRMEPDGRFEPKPGAARFDSGWLAPGALAGLVEALDQAPPWRYERAAETARRCRAALASHAEVVTAPEQATLVAFRVPGRAPTEIVTEAHRRGVVIRELPGLGLLRASCGYWTSDEDIERLVAALS